MSIKLQKYIFFPFLPYLCSQKFKISNMSSIDILTGQHITIKYEPANISKRMLALILDYIFMGAYMLALFYVFFEVFNQSFDWQDADAIIFVVLCLPLLCYHVIFETLMNGQTPGKVIAKIRVTNIDGSTPNFLSYFLRWLLLPVDLMPYGGTGALFIVFTKNHQRLGDLAAGTIVVNSVSSSSKFNLDNIFDEFSEDYRPVFREAELLTEGQIQLITQLLDNSSKEKSIEHLARKIKQKINIETKMNNRKFLETIVKDYNYYAASGV